MQSQKLASFEHLMIPKAKGPSQVIHTMELCHFLSKDKETLSLVYIGLKNPGHKLFGEMFTLRSPYYETFGSGKPDIFRGYKRIGYSTTNSSSINLNPTHQDSVGNYYTFPIGNAANVKIPLPMELVIDVEGKSYLHEPLMDHCGSRIPMGLPAGHEFLHGMRFHIGGYMKKPQPKGPDFSSYPDVSMNDILNQFKDKLDYATNIKIGHIGIDELWEHACLAASTTTGLTIASDIYYNDLNANPFAAEIYKQATIYLSDKFQVDIDAQKIFDHYYNFKNEANPNYNWCNTSKFSKKYMGQTAYDGSVVYDAIQDGTRTGPHMSRGLGGTNPDGKASISRVNNKRLYLPDGTDTMPTLRKYEGVNFTGAAYSMIGIYTGPICGREYGDYTGLVGHYCSCNRQYDDKYGEQVQDGVFGLDFVQIDTQSRKTKGYSFEEIGLVPTQFILQNSELFESGGDVSGVNADEFMYIEDLDCPEHSTATAELFATILSIFGKYSRDKRKYKEMNRAFEYIDGFIQKGMNGKYEELFTMVLLPFMNTYLKDTSAPENTTRLATRSKKTHNFRKADGLGTSLDVVRNSPSQVNDSRNAILQAIYTNVVDAKQPSQYYIGVKELAKLIRAYTQTTFIGHSRERFNSIVNDTVATDPVFHDYFLKAFIKQIRSDEDRLKPHPNSKLRSSEPTYQTTIETLQDIVASTPKSRVDASVEMDDLVFAMGADGIGSSINGKRLYVRTPVNEYSSITEDNASDDGDLDEKQPDIDIIEHIETYDNPDALKDVLTLGVLVFIHSCTLYAEQNNLDPETVQNTTYGAQAYNEFMTLFMEQMEKELTNKQITRLAKRMYKSCVSTIVYFSDIFEHGIDYNPEFEDIPEDELDEFIQRSNEIARLTDDELRYLDKADDGRNPNGADATGDVDDSSLSADRIPPAKEPPHIHRGDVGKYWLEKMSEGSFSGFVYKVLKFFTVTSFHMALDVAKLIVNVAGRGVTFMSRMIAKAGGGITTPSHSERIRVATRVNTNGSANVLFSGPDGRLESAKLAEKTISVRKFLDLSRPQSNRAKCLNEPFVDLLYQKGRLCGAFNGFLIEFYHDHDGTKEGLIRARLYPAASRCYYGATTVALQQDEVNKLLMNSIEMMDAFMPYLRMVGRKNLIDVSVTTDSPGYQMSMQDLVVTESIDNVGYVDSGSTDIEYDNESGGVQHAPVPQSQIEIKPRFGGSAILSGIFLVTGGTKFIQFFTRKNTQRLAMQRGVDEQRSMGTQLCDNGKTVLDILLSGKFVFETKKMTKERLQSGGKQYKKAYTHAKHTYFHNKEGFLYNVGDLDYAFQADDPLRFTLTDAVKMLIMGAEVGLGAYFAYKTGRQLYAKGVLRKDGANPIWGSIKYPKIYEKGYKTVANSDGSVIKRKPIYGVKGGKDPLNLSRKGIEYRKATADRILFQGDTYIGGMIQNAAMNAGLIGTGVLTAAAGAVKKFIHWFTADDINAITDNAVSDMQNSIQNIENNLEILLVGDADGDGIPDHEDPDFNPDAGDNKPSKPGLIQVILDAILGNGGLGSGGGSGDDYDPDAWM